MELVRHTILLTLAGSRSYGLATPESDIDVKGVAIPPRRRLLGLEAAFEQADSESDIAGFLGDLTTAEQAIAAAKKLDGSVYGLRKFMRLATQANPNILDVLYCRDAEVRRCDAAGEALRANRDLFLSTRARQTYSGYARAQLGRIQRHRAWLLTPPTSPPTREAHGLPQVPLVPRQHREAAEAAIRKQQDRWELDLGRLGEADRLHVRADLERVLSGLAGALDSDAARWLAAARTVGLRDDLIETLKAERAYQTACRQWAAYQSWRAHRNRDRARLEAAHGYDTKHAAHLVRLLRMGAEILETGRVHVWRGPGGADDAEELQAIRAGAWDYERLLTTAEEAERRLTQIVQSGASVVPDHPQVDAIDALCVRLLEARLR